MEQEQPGEIPWAIGFDLGGTNLRVALVSAQGEVRARRSGKTKASRGIEAVIGDIICLIRETLEEADPSPILGIGVASPGPLDPKTGVIHRSPNLGWTKVPLKKRLEESLGIPTIVDNDSQMAAFGERWLGAGQGADHMVCLTLGTGVGGGVILNGQIYHGATGTAGHIGHYVIDPQGPRCGCGARGCLEAYASAPAIVQRTIHAINEGKGTRIPQLATDKLGRLTSYHIFQAAKEGDPLALDIFRETGHYLALALVSVINILDPQIVIISGQVALAGDLLLQPLRSRVKELAHLRTPVPIVQSKLGDDSGLIGAAGAVFCRAGVLK